MKNLMASVLGGVIAAGAAGSALATGNGLLELELSKPFTIYNSTGVTTYDAGTDRLCVTATLLATQLEGVEVYVPLGSATIDFKLKVNRYGRLSGGVPGDDLRVMGSADLDDDGIPEYSGVLLRGEIRAFGWQEAGATDLFDTKFEITGGAMAGLYGKHVGITLIVENSTFEGNFCRDFCGGAKGTIGNADGDKCPKTPRTWKQNRCDWPVQQLTVGGVEYNAQQIYNILAGRRPDGSAGGNDPLIDLAQCVIAAKFSLLDGAMSDDDAVLAIAASDTFLASHPFGTALTEEETDLVEALKEALNAYLTDTSACGRNHGCPRRDRNPCDRYRDHGGWGCNRGGWDRNDCGDDRRNDCPDNRNNNCR